jgi:thiol-disulfide isomerase/thioredoxin
VQGPSAGTVFLLLSFAAGAACSLAAALLAGNKAFAFMKRSRYAEEWVRRALGVAVLGGVLAVVFGWDTGILRRLSLSGTSGLEQHLLDRFHPVAYAGANVVEQLPLGKEGSLPSLDGAVAWLNSKALSRSDLKGKVVLIDFWTYSCINCLRAIPYVEAWSEKYKNDGLVVIGVHTPEFAFEKDRANISKALQELKVTYPIAIDSDYAIWRAFNNQYWPAHYFSDASGTIRFHHFGEGEYDKSEQVIQQLLRERSANLTTAGLVQVAAAEVQASPDMNDIRSPETYVGYEREQNFLSSEKIKRDAPALYSAPGRMEVNNWGLAGKWSVENEHATWLPRRAKSSSVFTLGTCIWCLVHLRVVSWCDSAFC